LSMIQLDLHDLSWINDAVDDPNDYFAHGNVALAVSGVVWISPEGKWMVSAGRSGLHGFQTAVQVASS